MRYIIKTFVNLVVKGAKKCYNEHITKGETTEWGK